MMLLKTFVIGEPSIYSFSTLCRGWIGAPRPRGGWLIRGRCLICTLW